MGRVVDHALRLLPGLADPQEGTPAKTRAASRQSNLWLAKQITERLGADGDQRYDSEQQLESRFMGSGN